MLTYKNYTIEHDENHIIINGEPVKVIENKTNTYKINKKCISAHRGAAGLYSFLKEMIDLDFGLVWVDNVITGAEKIAAATK